MSKLKNNKRKSRARNAKGRYVADDPKTPDRNEAYKSRMSVLQGYSDTIRRFFKLY